ncbi:MAG TPA: hypothetical protein VIF09_13420 [Polyangiaceae bacterium]
MLTDGCATSIVIDAPGPLVGAFEQCLSTVLAGRRIACGAQLSCMTALWSTVQ